MKKNIFIVILFVCVVAFCSCRTMQKEAEHTNYNTIQSGSKYGAYLAARVAHIRKDFKNAANYYSKTVDLGVNDNNLLSQLYILYASTGDLAQASKYAKKLQENGDENSFLTTIIAVDAIKAGDYKDVISSLTSSDVPIYSNFINPLILAWAYAGENNLDAALKQLKILKKEPSFAALYNFQVAMIYDYFKDTKQAEKYYTLMVTKQQRQVSFRALQVISNFYLRQNQKEKAIELVSLYSNDELFAPMLNKLLRNINSQSTKPSLIINSPSKGLAESLFSIAATLRSENQNTDLAHIFSSMALYSNPNYDLAKLLLADILEDRQMFQQANDIYDSINKDSEAYEISLRKKAQNYTLVEDYKNAEITLIEILEISPDDMLSYTNLGDALRMQEKHQEAIKAYNKAIDAIKVIKPEHWSLYYALGVSYERNNNWPKAEKAFLKSLDLSNNHYWVQNYLGYYWLSNNINTDKAVALIIDAYRQVPNDGNIADSLGYAFYKLGFYDKAIKYLEEAVLLEPNNATITQHLGDAYYMGGRQTEAGFQWQQSLLLNTLSSDSDYNAQSVNERIENGLTHTPLVIKDKSFVEEKIKELGE